ncbi:DUF4397 domain-containing protein [Gallaecimonas sp. GXIMD4217]|uniref:DUF4397 domain-containing protein n=1 Tax=Gallaecimonas sp. GXIMD4217 TaxID=3131927 RepID=UPI00311AD319
MFNNKNGPNEAITRKTLLPATLLALLLGGCSTDGSDDGETGYVQLYNASANAPTLYPTIDDNQHSGAAFGRAVSRLEYDTGSYDFSLSWTAADDTQVDFYDESLKINNNQVSFIAVAGDFASPQTLVYQFAVEDPDEDFSFRFFNLSNQQDLDLYISEGHESFADAELVGSYSYLAMSESHLVELGNYRFYLTAAGNQEVLFESGDIGFTYTSQYKLIARANTGPGQSSLVLDLVSNSSGATALDDINASTRLQIYHGIPEAPSTDLHLGQVDDSPELTQVAPHSLSGELLLAPGDFSLQLVQAEGNALISQNHLVTLNPNDDRTVFFYTDIEIDEETDEQTREISTIIVDNATNDGLYEHHIDVVNLVQAYDYLNVYFVRGNETIDTAAYKLSSIGNESEAITLPNGDYQVLVTTSGNSNRLLLASTVLALDEDQPNQFLVVEDGDQEGSFTLTRVTQTP